MRCACGLRQRKLRTLRVAVSKQQKTNGDPTDPVLFVPVCLWCVSLAGRAGQVKHPTKSTPLLSMRKDPVPEFGKWEKDVLYTAYFERARKADTSGSDNRQMAPPANAHHHIHKSSRPHTILDPTAVVRRTCRQEVPKATKGQHPARIERQTRAAVSNPRRMTSNPSHPHRDTVYQGVGTNRPDYVYDIQSSSSQPRGGGGAGRPPPWERNSSTESGSGTGSIPPSARGRSRLRPLAEGERTPGHRTGVPKFGDWNVDGPSADYGFTRVFGQLRDEKKTSTSSVAATETAPTPSLSGEKLNAKSEPKCWVSLKGCWPWRCSSRRGTERSKQ
ncbi:RPM1-interacting protein 4-like isoform X1 [Punica granatum]|uniref:RPM1-interacting protein 4-like isoform X1 n=1 Tax=Punica granatum TaxID=22663 RepID=A0A6P8ELS5_PUNGR|nr:RPM1-interacting protein 4-like isoform X1 [Punica granatum]